MATAAESVQKAEKHLKDYKALPSTVTGTNLYDVALDSCADAIDALEADGKADAELVAIRDDIRNTKKSTKRVEDILKLIKAKGP